MSYTVAVDHPHFPEGMEFNVSGLGIIPNGSSTEVDEESERLFILQHGVTVDEGFANDAVVATTGSSALDQSEVDDLIALTNPPEEEAPAEEDTSVATPSTPTAPSTPTTPVGGATDDSATTSSGGGDT